MITKEMIEQEGIDNTIEDDCDKMDKHAYEHALGELTEQQKKEVRRLEFSSKTKRVLASRVGYRCSNPNCKVRSTIGPGDDSKSVVLLGEAAHIIGAIQDGEDKLSPRSDSSKKVPEIIGLDNGIWLCRNCHKLVDSKTSTYSIEILRTWKKDAEDRQAKILEEQPSQFIEEYVYPSISANKGINTRNFKDREWCLLMYMFSIQHHSNSSKLKFERDDEGNNFETKYRSWMSEKAIPFKTCGIDFDNDWQIVNQTLRKITDTLVGLVKMDSEGLKYGEEFDNFFIKVLQEDSDAESKIIKKLSAI